MSLTQKRVFAILIGIGIVYFAIFLFPNNTGAKNRMMISLFEPDEFAQYHIVRKMLAPQEGFNQAVLSFIAYGHYYYGSPFYFGSALILLPLKLTRGLDNVQLNLLLLRQIISVLPMLAALLFLTYIQTRFLSYPKSIGLFVFLLAVPAVVDNNMWWHVDSLALLFSVLTFFFLDRDDLRFGRDFYFAAAATGLATGTKVIGLFFFLVIPAYLLLGILDKRISWRGLLLRSAGFVVIMALTILISNPFLLIPSQFQRMVQTLTRQSAAMSTGWTLNYAKGPASWLPIIKPLYGQSIFITLAMLALGMGIWRGTNRRLHLLIAAWALPFSLYILFVIAIKPAHFFLPILLPVFSSLVVLFELPPFASKNEPSSTPYRTLWLWGALVLSVIAYQTFLYVSKDIGLYKSVLTREQHEGSLVFYDVLETSYIPRIISKEPLVVFRDVRMYFPDNSRWIVRTYWNAKYSTIEKIRPDIIILWVQRIRDYTQAGAQANAVDPAEYQDTYQFYVDAAHDQLRGYHLLYRDGVGLIFVSDAIYEKYFQP
jgi:hypothetical protein